jgi:trk system potassium uptake protein TrkH
MHPGTGFTCVFIAAVLGILEVSLSFDNAVVNAAKLDKMTPQWQQRFITWGIAIAVFGIGAVILAIRYCSEFGLGQGIELSIFHSVSAFCNAGFDIFGRIAPGQSLIPFNNDPIVLLTLMALITIGGLGFFVWEELARVRKFKKFSVYTKLVLIATATIILVGATWILVLEWNNPDTFGPMPIWQKILNAFFQAVTLRTAGFVAVDQALLTDSTKGLSLLIMLIGGSSGSTAGGMKTVTFVVLMLFIWAKARGRSTVHVFHRTVPNEKAIDAMTIFFIVVGLAFFGGVFIAATAEVSFVDALYESVSALATVGLTAGVTTVLGVPAQLMIVLFMFFGRVGVLSISLGFLIGDKAEDRFRYADTNLLIG